MKAPTKAIDKLEAQASNLNISFERTKLRSGYRKHGANGSTFSPGVVCIIEGIRLSLAQAKQFLTARERT